MLCALCVGLTSTGQGWGDDLRQPMGRAQRDLENQA